MAKLIWITGVILLLLGMAIPVAGAPMKRDSSGKIARADDRPRLKALAAGGCYDINWATWTNFTGVPDNIGSNNTTPASASGTIIDADGFTATVTMQANYNFYSSNNIYQAFKFSGYPAPVPTGQVPETTWSKGSGGTTTMTFNKTVTNPVLLLSSLGSSAPISSTLNFSLPYVVLYDGGGMVYNSPTSLTGTEGYAIIMFPGDFQSVTINSSTPEYYTNLTWGIRPKPFDIIFNDGPVSCGSFTATAAGGVTYHWNDGDTPNQATNTFHTSGTYLVTVTNSDGCTTSASHTVTVHSSLSPTASGNTTGCGSVTLTATGGTTYQWSGGTDPTSATNTFTTSGTYTVTASNPDGCTGISPPITVTINQAPPVAISGVTSDCNQVVLNATPGFVKYQWDGGTNPATAINTFTQSGTYTVTATDVNGCTTTASATVNILGPIPVIVGSTTGCTTVVLTATGGTRYHWDGGDTPDNPTNTFHTTGDYTVTVNNTTSCVGVKTVHVDISLPSPTISGVTSGCGSVTLTAAGGVSYSWDGGDTPLQATNTFHTSGTYTVTATNANGCSYPAQANVVVYQVPAITLQDMVVKDRVAIQADPVVTGNVATYLWSPAAGLSDPTQKMPLVNPDVPTTYTLKVTSVDGCETTATMAVTLYMSDIVVPNTFTPNGDGVNDTWNIQYLPQHTDANVDIYNRYGAHIFHSIGYSAPWNGSFNGKPVPTGTYFYVIDLHTAGMRPRTGSVTVIR